MALPKLPSLPKIKVNIPTGLLSRLEWWWTGLRRDHVSFIGPSAAGKTQVGVCLWKSHAGAGAVASKGLIDQYQSAIANAPYQSKSVTRDAAATSHYIEYLDRVPLRDGRTLRILFWPAEVIYAGPNESRAFRSLREIAPRGMVVVVLNPFAMDKALAVAGLLGSIAFLQRTYQLSFVDALVKTANALFGIKDELWLCRWLTRGGGQQLGSDDVDNYEGPKTLAEYFSGHDLGPVLVKQDPAFSGAGRRPFIYDNCPGAVGEKIADAIISRLANVYVDFQFSYVKQICDWINVERSRRFVLVFTRRDLVTDIDGLSREDFDRDCLAWVQANQLQLAIKDILQIGLLKEEASYGLTSLGTPITRQMATNIDAANQLATWLLFAFEPPQRREMYQ